MQSKVFCLQGQTWACIRIFKSFVPARMNMHVHAWYAKTNVHTRAHADFLYQPTDVKWGAKFLKDPHSIRALVCHNQSAPVAGSSDARWNVKSDDIWLISINPARKAAHT